MSASVYFIQMGEDGPIKIGYARDPKRRMYELRTASPYPLHLIGTITPATRADEIALHRRFGRDRLEGEWFSPSPALMEIAQQGVSSRPLKHKSRTCGFETTIAVRIPVQQRRMLELISQELGHLSLSETLRMAIDEYVAAKRRERLKAA